MQTEKLVCIAALNCCVTGYIKEACPMIFEQNNSHQKWPFAFYAAEGLPFIQHCSAVMVSIGCVRPAWASLGSCG